jgi:hypothetical protein
VFKHNAFLNWIIVQQFGCFAPEKGETGTFEKKLGPTEHSREESQLLLSV